MDAFLALLQTMPVVVFAVFSVLTLGYWLMVLVGAADIDVLDGISGKVDGIADGLLDGVVDGAVDGVVDGAVEGAVDGAVDGAADGVGDAAHGSFLGDFLSLIGLGKVPVTILLSLFSLLGFFLAASTRHFLDPLLPDWGAALVASGVATVGGVALAALITRPLHPIFEDKTAEQGGKAFIGRTCFVTIGVDEKGGQVRVDDRAFVSVRCVGHTLERGEEAVITGQDEDGIYVVEPIKALLPSTQDAFAALERAERESAAAVVDVEAAKVQS